MNKFLKESVTITNFSVVRAMIPTTEAAILEKWHCTQFTIYVTLHWKTDVFRIICGNWCVSDWSDGVKVTAWTDLYGECPRKIMPYKTSKLNLAKKHENKPDEYWQHVIWSDETKINYFGSDQIKHVLRGPVQNSHRVFTVLTNKWGGGSLLIWDCMSVKGVREMTFIELRSRDLCKIGIIHAQEDQMWH